MFIQIIARKAMLSDNVLCYDGRACIFDVRIDSFEGDEAAASAVPESTQQCATHTDCWPVRHGKTGPLNVHVSENSL
jgi:hypothetical protein